MISSDQANLHLICGGEVEPGTGICWALPIGAEPSDAFAPTDALPTTYLDAGVVAAPALADGTFIGGTFPVRFDETNRVTTTFTDQSQVRHLIVDVVDGVDRIRWQLSNVELRPTPGRVVNESGAPAWHMTATVAAQDVAVTRSSPSLP